MASALLASCAPGNSPNYGPLASGGLGVGQNCIPVQPGGIVSYGFEAFHNPGPAARVTRVNLAEPRGLRILQAWMVPITEHDLYGVLDGYPPYAHLPRGSSGLSGSRLMARSSPICGDRPSPTWSWC